jgi:excisionase family DNA binding protein
MAISRHRYRQSRQPEFSVEERVELTDIVKRLQGSTPVKIQVGRQRAIVVPFGLRQPLRDLLVIALSGLDANDGPLAGNLTTAQAAKQLGVSRPFVVALVDAGKLPATKVGTHRRIRSSDLATFIAQQDARRSQALTSLMRETRRLGLDY